MKKTSAEGLPILVEVIVNMPSFSERAKSRNN